MNFKNIRKKKKGKIHIEIRFRRDKSIETRKFCYYVYST